MPLPFGGFYLYAPYGPVVDGKSEIRNPKSETIFNELISKFPQAIFIRIEPKNVLLFTGHYSLFTKSANIQPGKTLIINLNQSEDQLLAQMHPKTRYNIKVAQKHGVEIQDEFGITAEHGLYLSRAVNLLVQTGKRQGFANYPKTYFEKMADFFVLQNQTSVKAEEMKIAGDPPKLSCPPKL